MNGQVLNDLTEYVWRYLYEVIKNPFGVAGLMGSMYLGSELYPKYHDIFAEGLSMKEFVHNGEAYGVMQWKYWGDKQSLYNTARKLGLTVGNIIPQVELIREDLTGVTFSDVLCKLKSSESIREACDIVLDGFYGGRERKVYGSEDRYLATAYGLYYYYAYSSKGYSEVEKSDDIKLIEVTKSKTAIRSTASILGKKIGYVSKGDTYHYAATSRNGCWRGIFFKDKIGWIPSKYTKLHSESVPSES